MVMIHTGNRSVHDTHIACTQYEGIGWIELTPKAGKQAAKLSVV